MNLIQKICRKILFKLIPEMYKVLSYEKDMDNIKTYSENSKIDVSVKLDRPYRIYQSAISRYSYVSVNSRISLASIGSFCSIGPNFLCGWGIHPINGLSTSPTFYSMDSYNGFSLASQNKIEERKEIVIGNDVFIGANVTVLDGVFIGDGAVIAAGSVVVNNIPAYAIAGGVPAVILKYRFTDDEITALEKIQWWNWDNDKLKNVERYFYDITLFISKHG